MLKNHPKVATENSDGSSQFRISSREEVVKCPHMMALLRYLHDRHDLPKYAWKKKGLRYHYTDAAGLLGIIQNGRLWATDLRFLNDPSEGAFLPDRILAFMCAKSGGITGIETKIIEGLKSALRNPRSTHSSFAVSLSANGDLLSQWRGYGSFGKGYAIGFNLDNGLPHSQIASFYDVTYGEEGLVDVALDLLDLFVSATEKWRDMMYDEWASTLSVIARSFKNPGYSEEQESRLVCSHTTEGKNNFQNELPLRFRTRGSDIIPYIPMSLDLLRDGDTPRLPIDQIIVGPGVEFERNFAAIKALLKEHSYDNVIVEPSAIPFRP